ncbi:mechanosensitive ion channel family protein [Thalassotalea sp. HSM 43]|uniref:mechanosensitive ion channel family protein n=1 Tax=Thalassotalea sp. HSM 43 TaxID=2552945 RepID=UPI00167923EC|nr:mechanosensitive ion channel family protein [Thalassotalea sp. HSM 43]
MLGNSRRFIVFIFVCLPFFAFAQESLPADAEDTKSAAKQLKQTLSEIADYRELIEQIESEQKDAFGFEKRALGKQRLNTLTRYRNLLQQYIEDITALEEQAFVKKHQEKAINLVEKALQEIYDDLAVSDKAVGDLEQSIADALKNIFSLNEAPAKDRVAQMLWKLNLIRRYQEDVFHALVYLSRSAESLGLNADKSLALAEQRVRKQADTLSGFIGLNEDKLLQLEKKKAVVRTESDTGKALISQSALVNLEIQEYANRLQHMVTLLNELGLSTALYKKTVIQARDSLSKEVLDGQVFSHLVTEWWLDFKKWMRRQAPSLIGSAITLIGIFVVAYLLSKLVRRIVSISLHRSRPDMSELARSFLIVSSGRLIILLGIIYALAQLGVQIGPLLAGLGIMGFVIGFALQETLANFASGLMILIYRPYDVGDKIRVAGLEGRVKEMTLVTTTIFTSANHHLTVPNNTIWKDIIQNITSQPHVRMDLFFTAPFASDSKAILSAIDDELNQNKVVEQDRDKHARVYELGESEVKYIARFWVSSDDIDEAKWSISEAVKQRFDNIGIGKDS